MIYYADDDKNKKDQSKKEYIRDLLQFFTFCEAVLKAEGKDTELIIFKQLEKRHIRNYHKWLQEVENGPIRI